MPVILCELRFYDTNTSQICLEMRCTFNYETVRVSSRQPILLCEGQHVASTLAQDRVCNRQPILLYEDLHVASTLAQNRVSNRRLILLCEGLHVASGTE